MLQEVTLCSDDEDVHDWMLEAEGDFKVRSCYELFLRGVVPVSIFHVETLKALESLWKAKVPPKLKFFGWRVLLNQIATKNKLLK